MVSWSVMQTAPSCARRASSAKSASSTRLSREYSVCMCMSRRVCSTGGDLACAVPGLGQTVAVRTSRLEAFSDGVFAIAATLLVLELRVPPGEPDLVRALIGLWPAYAAYLISFLTIGIIWGNHHTLLEHCRRVDRPFLYLNLLLLIAGGIVPFPTALGGEYIPSDRGATAALVVHGLGAGLIGIRFRGAFLYPATPHRL